MKRIHAIILLFAFIAFSADGPTDEVNAEDYVDPKLKAFDKRVWQNLLKYYVHARQIARGTLEELESVKDFCWSSYRYLYAIERAANRAKLVWDNVKNFKAENPVDAIIYLEEDVFQKSDLLLKNDIPAIKRQRERLTQSRNAIRNRAGNHLAALNDMLPDGLRFEKNYLRLLEINSPDARMLQDDSDKEVNLHAAALAQASKQIAAGEIRNEFADNQSAMLESTIKNADNNGVSDPLHQSEFSKVGERNSFILSLQENVQLTDAVKTDAFFLMLHAKKFAGRLAARQALFFAMEDFSDELGRQEVEQ